jgi:hypothetical protein
LSPEMYGLIGPTGSGRSNGKTSSLDRESPGSQASIDVVVLVTSVVGRLQAVPLVCGLNIDVSE